MLARLNAELCEKDDNIKTLMTQIGELKKENGRHEGRFESSRKSFHAAFVKWEVMKTII